MRRSIQARGHHDTEKIGHNTKFWLDKYVLGEDVTWPEHPKSEIRLDADGVPELVVTPASPDRVTKVEMFYALKNPCSFARSWRDNTGVRQGNQWIGKMPVLNVDDYRELLTILKEAKAGLDALPRIDMKGGKAIPQERNFGRVF